jgi:hypothetical protein
VQASARKLCYLAGRIDLRMGRRLYNQTHTSDRPECSEKSYRIELVPKSISVPADFIVRTATTRIHVQREFAVKVSTENLFARNKILEWLLMENCKVALHLVAAQKCLLISLLPTALAFYCCSEQQSILYE